MSETLGRTGDVDVEGKKNATKWNRSKKEDPLEKEVRRLLQEMVSLQSPIMMKWCIRNVIVLRTQFIVVSCTQYLAEVHAKFGKKWSVFF